MFSSSVLFQVASIFSNIDYIVDKSVLVMNSRKVDIHDFFPG